MTNAKPNFCSETLNTTNKHDIEGYSHKIQVTCKVERLTSPKYLVVTSIMRLASMAGGYLN